MPSFQNSWVYFETLAGVCVNFSKFTFGSYYFLLACVQPSVRKQHNSGYKHKANVRAYYQQFEQQQTQSLIDQRIKDFESRSAVAFQAQVAAAFKAQLAAGSLARPAPANPMPIGMSVPPGGGTQGGRPGSMPPPGQGPPPHMMMHPPRGPHGQGGPPQGGPGMNFPPGGMPPPGQYGGFGNPAMGRGGPPPGGHHHNGGHPGGNYGMPPPGPYRQ